MEPHELWSVVIALVVAFASSATAIAVAAWHVGGQIKSLAARLGNVEREVHDIRADIRSINEHLRRPQE